jgi:hypothetical protein
VDWVTEGFKEVLTTQAAMQVEWQMVDWDQVLLSQVGALVLLLEVEVCMVAGSLLALDLALGVESLSRLTQDVELDQDQPTRVVV